MYSFSLMVIIFIFWVIVGYLLVFVFGNGFIGSFDWIFFYNVGFVVNDIYLDVILYILFMMF